MIVYLRTSEEMQKFIFHQRKLKGLTLREVERQFGFDHATVNGWESGGRLIPFTQLVKYLDKLGWKLQVVPK